MNPQADTGRPLLDYLQKATQYLSERGVESPRLSAELLLADLLATTRLDLYLRFEEPLSAERVEAYRERIRRRARHEPVAYILGQKEFYGRQFHVNPSVLIPRPETEHLVERALAFMQGREPARLLDVGTGSGILAVTLLLECPDWQAVATDVSTAALAMARDNAQRFDLAPRLAFRQGSLYTCLEEEENFPLIVSNPPYIRKDEVNALREEVRVFEPDVAWKGGEDGLLVLRPLIGQAPQHLVSDGLLLCEFGAGQGEAVAELAVQAGFSDVEIMADLAGKPRVLVARREGD